MEHNKQLDTFMQPNETIEPYEPLTPVERLVVEFWCREIFGEHYIYEEDKNST